MISEAWQIDEIIKELLYWSLIVIIRLRTVRNGETLQKRAETLIDISYLFLMVKDHRGIR